ncbi:MAG: hypothetical protein SXV54_16465, partial [Chloroflexota bacterium]|nr:hypothetical protein [Chloroflexota bacterium]
MRPNELPARLLNPRADLSRLHPTHPTHGGSREGATEEENPKRRFRWRHIFLNVPLLVGGLITLILFIGVLFGPVLAPENPYLRGRRVLEYVDGTFYRPPFPPSPEHPMGTDELGRDT